ncbi:hypothetical protein K491DRAFT_698343 [Lophiostoma macrostomum CBS 122681]|uniref:Uncharacterized protein n=1 Tax=Lophiostoma macrostomum CBS 122681 TaxID=1314788 RepID=A0A6A6SQ96_9PLEO|nr:hypothetical protein K491DRAFT_698343 [Lophiostoma macrostomum CBS 122681]
MKPEATTMSENNSKKDLETFPSRLLEPPKTLPAMNITGPHLEPTEIFTAYFAALDALRDSTTQRTAIIARLTNFSNPSSAHSDTLLLRAKIAINDQILQAYHDFNTEWGWMTGKLMTRLLDLAGTHLDGDKEKKIKDFDDGMKKYQDELKLVREHGWIWRRWVWGMQGLGDAEMSKEAAGLERDLSGVDLRERRNVSTQGIYRWSDGHPRRSDLLSSLGGMSVEDSDADFLLLSLAVAVYM